MRRAHSGPKSCKHYGHRWGLPGRPVMSEPGLDFQRCERCGEIQWLADRAQTTYVARNGFNGRRVWNHGPYGPDR